MGQAPAVALAIEEIPQVGFHLDQRPAEARPGSLEARGHSISKTRLVQPHVESVDEDQGLNLLLVSEVGVVGVDTGGED